LEQSARPAAVTNAVVDALSPYGVSHIDMPTTPNRIWRLIRNRRAPAGGRIEDADMTPFAYHKPATIADAVALFGCSPDSRYLAGGMTLLPSMKQRLQTPAALIDLSALPGLSGISRAPGALHIGAMTRHADVARSDIVKAAIPALAMLAGHIGDPAVRNCGTLGGSLANNDPSAD
jgi:xanthine dehydrogenase iron-sulfur cluster and FAD-binding subunit A